MEKQAKVNLIVSTAVFGTIGVFVKYIDAPTSFIALMRGLIAAAFIFFTMKAMKRDMDWKDLRDNMFVLIIAGIVLACNWIFLFESYKYTTVAISTICYYLEPTFLVLLAPHFLNEKINRKKLICVIVALIGMVFVSGVFEPGNSQFSLIGIALATAASLFFTAIVIINKRLHFIDATILAMAEMFFAGIIMIPYCFMANSFSGVSLNLRTIVLLLIVCFVHTGICYVMYYSSIQKLSAQTVAIFAYLDPIVSILCSVLILKEALSANALIGGILILGSTFVSEYKFKRKGVNGNES